MSAPNITQYEAEHGIHEWHCKSCGGCFDNLDIVTLEKECAFCGSRNIEPLYTSQEENRETHP